MVIDIPRSLDNDIMNFVKLNEIKDVNEFLTSCLRIGYNIAKYGTSPQDNFEKENKPFNVENYDEEEKNKLTGVEGEEKPKKRGRPKKQQTEEKSVVQKQEEAIKPKKTIRIIKK